MLFAVGAIAATHLFPFKPRKPTRIKQMPYESGMDPIGDARQPFDVKFYLVAILFLVFDVELLFLYPWAVIAYGEGGDQTWRTAFGTVVFVEMLVFIATLVIAYVYAWRKGVFQWRYEPAAGRRGHPARHLANWARKNSLWPMPFATACCGIELMATGAQPHDIARFGAEVMRFSPRQCDLMIVAGRVVMKMLPVLQRIWLQMPEPKWCISMGACASTRRRVRHLRRGAGHRPVHPGGHVRARLPAAAGAADPGDHRHAGEDPADGHDRRPRVRGAHRVRGADGVGRASLPPEEAIVAPGDLQHRDAACRTCRLDRHGERERSPLRIASSTCPLNARSSAGRRSPRRDVPRQHARADRRRRRRRCCSPLLKCLKDECGFDMLAELGGVDYLQLPDATDRFGVVYGLTNTATGERVIVKAFVNDPDPELPSVVPLWKGADWMEREVYDMYGIASTATPTCGGS